MVESVLFVVGFPVLIKGADFLVSGASSIAKRLKISDLVIGLTIVSFGTSAPELIVNLLASYRGASDLAISNVLGSNIANILLILGTAALITPLKVKSNTVWKEIPFGLLAVVLLFLMGNDSWSDAGGMSGVTMNILSRVDGVVFLSFFVIFLYYTFGLIQTGDDKKANEGIDLLPWNRSVFYILLGMASLALGGQWIVEGAVSIADRLSLPEAIVGVTIVAIGTSLPELATSVVAAWKRNTDIAVGNVAGSNIFNVFWILGASAVIRPLPYNAVQSDRDALMSILVALLLFVGLFVGKKNTIYRWEGGLFLVVYFGYMIYLIF